MRKPESIPARVADSATTLTDPMAPVRAKSLRSLGKMAINGLLDPEGSEKVAQACRKVLGRTGFNWDNAYIVRVEAEEILRALKR